MLSFAAGREQKEEARDGASETQDLNHGLALACVGRFSNRLFNADRDLAFNMKHSIMGRR